MHETDSVSQRWLEKIHSRLGSGHWRDRNKADAVCDDDQVWYAARADRTGDHKDVDVEIAE